MLRRIRIALAAIFFVGVSVLLLDFTGTLHAWLGWMAKVQFLPAVLAVNTAVILVLCLLTLLLGRVYCSVICPLGVWQDVVSHLSARREGFHARFSYSKEKKWLRYGVWTVFILALIAGVHALVALLAPYSAWGRIVQNLFQPLYLWGNNLLAWLSARLDGYAFYHRDVWIRSTGVFAVTAATFALVSFLAWKSGRTWCNTLCPVGTTLGFLSRYSLLRPVIDADRCKDCHACEKHCKASCISIKDHTIDYSRCVDCFDCLDVCHFDALHYRFAWKKTAKEQQAVHAGRRAFLGAGVLAATTLSAQDKKRDGGLAAILPKREPVRSAPLTPPGSKSNDDFYRRCTACQLCVSACPNDVLRPSTDLEHFMQPHMSYEKGYCRPECVRCSQVCPSGAILPITAEEKTVYHIGKARIDYEACLPSTEGVSCGNCARHCPAGAIKMVRKDPSDPESPRIPTILEQTCIGCGACENLCPVRPVSAITVDGLTDNHVRA